MRRVANGPGAPLWILALWLAGCVPPLGGWDYEKLPGPWRGLEVVRDSRLSDSAPHLVPVSGGLLLFLCRWPDAEPIRVSLPPDADPRELEILRTGLRAWASAGLGVRFLEVEPGEERLEIRFVAKSSDARLGTGDALADCAIERDEGGVVVRDGRIRAELRWASVHLIREDRDALGRPVQLDDDQLLGAALHELGHALGYPAHPATGASIMQPTTEGVEAMARGVAEGAGFSDPNLAALYALPTGVVVGRLPLSAAQSQRFEALDRAAEQLGLAGPFSRTADHSARYFYRGARRLPVALTARRWRRDLSRPSHLDFEPNANAEALFRVMGVIPAPSP